MKAYRLAYVFLILILLFVIINTCILTAYIESIEEDIRLCTIKTDAEKIEDIHDKFTKCKDFIGLTVSHDDLTNIEDIFAEFIASKKADDDNGVIVAKSRLENALLHLRRLVGFNVDSIF